MLDWRIQVFKFAVLTRIPFGDFLRRLKRRHFGYEPDPDNIRGTLEAFDQMTAALKAAGRSFDGATVLEIGSGWFPTIPIKLTLDGAKAVVMTDLNHHMDDVTIAATLRVLRRSFPADHRLNALTDISDLPITYLAPFDARNVPDGSIDFVISRTVLEHVPPGDLEGLLSILRSKLKPDGLMVHFIDHSDHLEHQDKTISKLNFLTWSVRKHNLVNYLIKAGENRLRHHEYPALFERAGLRVVSDVAHVHEQTLERVATLSLAKPYSEMSAVQLSALSSIYVLASGAAGHHQSDGLFEGL